MEHEVTVWFKFECEHGARWTEVRGPFSDTHDGDMCWFSGCPENDHRVKLIGATTIPNEAAEWFRRPALIHP